MNRDKLVDLRILAKAFIENIEYDGGCEYGSVGTDCKRPFGNSDVEGDILEMLECKPEGDDGDDECWSSEQREYARELYCDELATFLRANCVLKSEENKRE